MHNTNTPYSGDKRRLPESGQNSKTARYARKAAYQNQKTLTEQADDIGRFARRHQFFVDKSQGG